MSESVVAKAGEKQTLDGADVQIKLGYLLVIWGGPSLGLHCSVYEMGRTAGLQ